MNKFRILFVDDDNELITDLKNFFESESYSNHSFGEMKILATCRQSFDDAIELCQLQSFDLVVLDLMNGSDRTQTEGLTVFSSIENNFFAPIIFFSGFADVNPDLQSYTNSRIVDVISKGNTNLLKQKIREMIENPSSFVFLMKTISRLVREELKDFFWNHVHAERDKISAYGREDYSLNYMFMKKLSHSLSKSKIKKLTFDDLINEDKAHPMEFYIYPTNDGDFEPGEILHLRADNTYFILLTPACDLVENRGYKVECVLLLKAILLENVREYIDYRENGSNNAKDKLKNVINNNNNKSFFIPKTYFMPNLVAYFDKIVSVKIEDLKSNYSRVAKLDDPFTQSLITKFTNCYNRVGTSDIDIDHILTSQH